MKLVRLASRRSAARRSLLAVIALTLAVLTAVLAGIAGFAQLAATEALRSLAVAPGSQGYFRIHTTTADDAVVQQTAAESAFAELGLTNGLTISTAPYSPPRPLVPSGGSATNLPADLTFLPVGWTPTTTPAAGSLETLASAAGTEGTGTGTSRTGPVPAALEASTAESLGLALGDTFAVEGAEGTVRLELVATLNPVGLDAAFLDPVPVEDAETLPTAVAVPPDAIPMLSGEPKVQWVFTVDAETVTAAELSRLADGLRQLPQRLSSDRAVNDGDMVLSGELAGLLASAADATQSVRAVLLNALLLLVVLGAVTVVQFAWLSTVTRAAEDKLVSARGSSTVGQRAAVAAVEIVPVALGGCVFGWAAAAVLGPLLSTGSGTAYAEGMGGFVSASWTAPVLCAGITALVFVGVAVAGALRERNPAVDAARIARVAFFGVLALLVAVTALSLWQFLLHRSPLVEQDSGALRVNPVAAPAPALLLLTGSVLALVTTGGLARRVEHRVASRVPLGVSLAARQVSRGFASYIVPIALVTVTVGMATFTAAYAQTTSRSQAAASQLANGSDVRVTVPGPLVIRSADDVPHLAPYADGDAVTAASLAYRGEARLASVTAPLLAVDAASLPGLLGDGANLVDVGGLASALAFEPPVPEPALTLTASATQVRMQITSRGASEPPPDDDGGATARSASVTAWIRTGTGDLVPVPAGSLALSGAGDQAHSLSFALPEGLHPTAITAIDIALEASTVARGYELEITSVSSDGGIGTGQGRFIENSSMRLANGVFDAAQAGVQPLEEGVGARFPEKGSTAGAAQARLMAGAQGAPRLPVAVTAALLADLDLEVGDPVSLRPGGVEIQAVIAAVAPVLPGTTEGTAVLTDLQAYSSASLASSPAPPRPGEIWLASTDRNATAAAAAAAGLAGPGAAISTADNSLVARFLAPATTLLWIGVLGALLVGGVALAPSIVSLVQSRRSEGAVLRVLGRQARDQVRARRWEVLSTGAAAVVLGLLTGLGVAALTVPPLARAVVVNASEALRAPLSIAVVPLLGVLTVQVLILVLAAWFYGKRVKR